MEDIIDRAREYIAKHSVYSELLGHTFVTVDTLTAMVDFAKRETKEFEAQIEKMKNCKNCLYQGECDLSGYEECKNFDKWEMKEK